ncbi:MAG TPA: hypothetical protein VGR35_09640 [Tepidisphaeraceae bacterium]|nr:hypothetical protein [Tepidisphaeraceae bacterium]
MSEDPIPMQPEDRLLPPEWKRFDQFLHIFTIGGDMEMSPPMPSPDQGDNGMPAILVRHRDRGEQFLIIRMDEDEFIVRRIPPR